MIEKALDYLSEKVDEAEIFYLSSSSASIKTRTNDIDSFKERQASGYGIRVIKNKKMGFYFANSLDKTAMDAAVKVARVAERDENLSLPKKQAHDKNAEQTLNMEVEEGITMAEDLLSASKNYSNVNPTSGTIAWNSSRVTIANTNGFYGGKSDSIISAYLGTVAKGKEPSTGFHFEVSRQKDIDAFNVGDIACRLARDSLNAKNTKTAKKRVILRPMAVTELFEYTLIPSFSADNVQRGRSKLQNLVGEEIFKGINIIDDATLPHGLMSEIFDDEGVGAQKTTLVDSGVLKGFLYDSYSANKEGKSSTGNGERSSYSSLPGVGPSNFVISGDERIEDEDGALVVHGLVGAHTSNPISGDFSCETRNAFLDGVPIKKAIVSGNIFDVLRTGVMFGEDLEQYSSVLTPSIEFQDIMITG